MAMVLRFLEKGDFVSCNRNGKVFETNPRNVGSEREFYAISTLSEKTYQLIFDLFIKDSKSPLREMNEGWLNLFYKSSELKPELSKYNEFNNLEENLHSEIENELAPFINSIKQNDFSFLSDEEKRISFLIAVSQQYFRTKKMRDRMHFILEPRKNLNTAEILPVLRHIFATTFAFSIIQRDLQFTLLKMTLDLLQVISL
ncbi:DUF4238 domain-containing protein [Leptospira noguchii]|nr:DUF4238 domain-containing protein [Leptospira noguchii]